MDQCDEYVKIQVLISLDKNDKEKKNYCQLSIIREIQVEEQSKEEL